VISSGNKHLGFDPNQGLGAAAMAVHSLDRLKSAVLYAAFIALSTLVIAFGATQAASGVEGPSPRVLILYPYDERLPASNIAGEAARRRLIEATGGKIDLFSEFLDLSRFPEDVHIDRMARYLSEKYNARQPDVVIALGAPSTDFFIKHRDAIAPDAKLVFTGFERQTAALLNLPIGAAGAFSEFNIAKTFELARRLQPKARRVFVIGGSSDFDREWLKSARADLAAIPKSYETTYLEDLTIDEFTDRAEHFPRDSIVLFLTIFRDSAGRNFLPKDAAGLIGAKSSAPVYGPYDTYLGQDVVGGNAATFESMGTAVAGLAIEALAGKPITDIDIPRSYFVDARQLDRWGLSERALPPDTVLSNKRPSLWEEYWPAILATFAVVALQAAVIAVLLIERRRRVAAEGESQLRLMELVHLNQSATAGALSASIAHELNQPLGAIRSNTEAAEMILQSANPDLALIKQILADIREDDQRASDIIARLRGMLKKRSEIDWQEFDINDVINSSMTILQAQAGERRVDLSAEKPVQKLPVRADKVHLQQVIINIATNAMDAMAEATSGERQLRFQTVLNDDSKVELSISDTGTGIPSERLDSIFDAFYTTKPAGTGLGLPIARAIIETYGGKIWADNRANGGAVFRFVLPLARNL
jgi:signal transduction histidine kinase